MNKPMTAVDVRAWINEYRYGDDRVLTADRVIDIWRAVLSGIAADQVNPSPTRALCEEALTL